MSTDRHLARLFFEGGAVGGSYSPERIELRLQGADERTRQVVQAHEAHHASLNDSTAWGAGLLALAAIGGPQFGPMLDRCRDIHESFATWASVRLVADATGDDIVPLLGAFSGYGRLMRSMERAVAVPGLGPQRSYLLANALARICMQTPILDLMLATELGFELAEIREMDTPDGRWRWFRRLGSEGILDSARLGDLSIADTDELRADTSTEAPDSYHLARPEFDDAWNVWEQATYTGLARHLGQAGATCLEYNGHQVQATDLVALLDHLEPGHTVRAAKAGDHSESQTAASIADRVRYRIVDPPYHATRAEHIPWDEALDLIAAQQEIAGEVDLIINARRGANLKHSYRWSDDEIDALGDDVDIAVRLIASTDNGESAILHRRVDDVEVLREVLRLWGDRGRIQLSVAASCLADEPWRDEWLDLLNSVGELTFLIDVELARLIPSWVRFGEQVGVGLMRVTDTAGLWDVLVIEAMTQRWVAVADQFTTDLLAQQLDYSALEVVRRPEIVEANKQLLTTWITHLLATESWLDFDGLGYTSET